MAEPKLWRGWLPHSLRLSWDSISLLLQGWRVLGFQLGAASAELMHYHCCHFTGSTGSIGSIGSITIAAIALEPDIDLAPTADGRATP